MIMYLCPKEIAMLKSKEIRSLMGEYRKVFNETPPGLNYDEFDSIEDYVRILKECIKTKKSWYDIP